MICPSCLNNIEPSASKCLNCKARLPALYRDLHEGKDASSPTSIGLIGFSGHGKTSYLASLFHLLDHYLLYIWPKFFQMPLDPASLSHLLDIRRRLETGALPIITTTPKVFPKPGTFRLMNMPIIGDRTIVLYDLPGETFYVDQPHADIDLFKRTDYIVLLISPNNLNAPVADSLYQLLVTYINSRGIPKKAQHLIVAYTKADILNYGFYQPSALLRRLINNDLKQLDDLEKYFQEMQLVSDELANFTRSTLGANNFVKLAEAHFKSTRFSAVSALGHDPIAGKLEFYPRPVRVLDPLLWALLTDTGARTSPARIKSVIRKALSNFLDESFYSSKNKTPKRLRVFLCHSTDDKKLVRDLYNRLDDSGYTPWLDEEHILPGQNWDLEITTAVRTSHIVLVCMSKRSINKTGYVQKEIKYALDVADQQPEGTIFIIPLKFEECDVPERLRRWQRVNYFDESGHKRLMQALQHRYDSLKVEDSNSQ